MKKIILVGVSAIIIFVLFLLVLKSSNAESFENINSVDKIEIYKSITCGCCDVYTKYVEGKISSKVNSLFVQNPNEIKNRYGIPSELGSCHTTIIGGYFVEGHVPLEAVEKLLNDKPDISGIAMPGMPEGSPGMPGAKRGDFVIYAVKQDGSYEEWMRI